MLLGVQIEEAVKNQEIMITPFNPAHINPNSYDVTLSNKIGYYALLNDTFINYGQVDMEIGPDNYGHMSALNVENEYVKHVVRRPCVDLAHKLDLVEETIPEDGFVLYPNNIYLGMINEEIFTPKHIPEISGKSRLARAGVTIHQTAGYGNIGHRFRYVLEIEVRYPTIIYPNMKIGQIYFHEIDKDVIDRVQFYDGDYSENQRQESDHIPGYIPDKELTEYVTKMGIRRDLMK